MYMPTHTDQIALAQLARRDTLPLGSRVAVRVAYAIAVWTTRHRTRLALRHLSTAQLDDLGLTATEARNEAAKPFWRP